MRRLTLKELLNRSYNPLKIFRVWHHVHFVPEEEAKAMTREHARSLRHHVTEISIFLEDGITLLNTYFDRCSLVNNSNAKDVHFENCAFSNCHYYKNGVKVDRIIDLFPDGIEIKNALI